MAVILGDNIIEDIVGLGIEAGILTEIGRHKAVDPKKYEDERQRVRDIFQKWAVEYECDRFKQGLSKQASMEKAEWGTHAEETRWTARELAEKALLYTPKTLFCVCPEMKTDKHTASSKGGETSPDWKYRDKERKEGTDVPFDGCGCTVFTKKDKKTFDIIFDEVAMLPSS